MEYLLESKALPTVGASHYFCGCSDLSILHDAYVFSLCLASLGTDYEAVLLGMYLEYT
jgi:hypothetical protein